MGGDEGCPFVRRNYGPVAGRSHELGPVWPVGFAQKPAVFWRLLCGHRQLRQDDCASRSDPGFDLRRPETWDRHLASCLVYWLFRFESLHGSPGSQSGNPVETGDFTFLDTGCRKESYAHQQG